MGRKTLATKNLLTPFPERHNRGLNACLHHVLPLTSSRWYMTAVFRSALDRCRRTSSTLDHQSGDHRGGRRIPVLVSASSILWTWVAYRRNLLPLPISRPRPRTPFVYFYSYKCFMNSTLSKFIFCAILWRLCSSCVLNVLICSFISHTVQHTIQNDAE